jgi:hypothetical protein
MPARRQIGDLRRGLNCILAANSYAAMRACNSEVARVRFGVADVQRRRKSRVACSSSAVTPSGRARLRIGCWLLSTIA